MLLLSCTVGEKCPRACTAGPAHTTRWPPGDGVSTKNSGSIEKPSDLSRPAVVSPACSHTSRSFFHGSLVGFAAARNWTSRSLRSATNWQSYIVSVPAALGSPRSIAYLDLALPRMAAVPEPVCGELLILPGSIIRHTQAKKLWRICGRIGGQTVVLDHKGNKRAERNACICAGKFAGLCIACAVR
jgi:hypothetical protein